jgi:GNAT acetyltransferase-like protein
MAAINEDPEVMLYVNRPLDRAATAAFYAGVQKHWAEHGFGFYAVESIEDGPGRGFIGLVGIAHPTFVPELAARPELGWRLARHAWGRGLATEAARAVRDLRAARPARAHLDRAPGQRSLAACRDEARDDGGQRVRIPALEREADVWRLASPHPR